MGTRVVHAAAAMLTFALAAAACTSQADKVVIPPDEEPTTEETGGAGGAAEAPVCPYPGEEPAIDPSGFPECPMCSAGGARCVPKFLLPPEKLDSFSECDAENVCVPDIILETKGQFIPDTCTSVLGTEGRCLSRCLPTVAPKAADLPQDICAAADVCVPCYDPFTSEPTGACEQSCDPGPADPPIEIASCCGGDGVCLPSAEVGDKANDLGQDICPQHQGDAVCVPSSFLEPDFKPMGCVDGNFLGDGEGVCLPECLPAVQGLLTGLLLDQEGCPDRHICAPCDHPITGDPTGACDI